MRRHGTTIAVAMVTAAVTAGGPALAAAVAEAVNADTVDGKHAVGAAATLARRAGKLVATNGSGRLPNNIIAKAPDAQLFDGDDSTAFVRLGETATSADTLDGMDSTDFVNITDGTAPNAETLDGLNSTDFVDAANGTAPNADRLDNMNSTDFVSAANGTAPNADKLDNMNSTDFAQALHHHDERYFTRLESDNRFLAKTATAADSLKINTRTLEEVRSRQSVAQRGTGEALSPTSETIMPIVVGAPAAGRIEISGVVDVSINKPNATSSSFLTLQVRDSETSPSPPYYSSWTLPGAAPAGFWRDTLAVTTTFTVPGPGTYTYYLMAAGSNEASTGGVTLNAEFTPTR